MYASCRQTGSHNKDCRRLPVVQRRARIVSQDERIEHSTRKHFIRRLRMTRTSWLKSSTHHSRQAILDHQLNFSANWISLPGVDVAVSTPAVASGAPVPSNMSVWPRAIDGTSKLA